VLLVGVGALALTAGVLYWWKDWMAARLVLGLGVAAGLALGGLGALLWRPSSPAACLAAALALVSSGAMLFVVSLLQPLIPALPVVAAALAGLGGVSYVGYLFNRRRTSRPTSTPPRPWPPVDRH